MLQKLYSRHVYSILYRVYLLMLMKMDIRYLPNDTDSAYILYEEEKYPLRVTNRNNNCHTKRNNTPKIDYSKAEGES